MVIGGQRILLLFLENGRALVYIERVGDADELLVQDLLGSKRRQ